MKIGVFDSGLGGLCILKSMRALMPEYDYVYLGDTANLPYGEKNGEQIRTLSLKGVDFLFQKDCLLILLACNTASAHALTYLQDVLKAQGDTGKRIFGMIGPTVEIAKGYGKVGVLATTATTNSHMYQQEFVKQNSPAIVFEQEAPLLVPYIETGDLKQARAILATYLNPLHAKGIDALVLGCTHYPILKEEIRAYVGKDLPVISQDEILPQKLHEYLTQKKEIATELSKNGTVELYVTQKSDHFEQIATEWFEKDTNLTVVKI